MDEPARRVRALVDHIGRDERLDRVAEPLSSLASSVTRRDDVKRLLSGAWLGHRLHPTLTDVPIGAWTSASILDLIGGRAGRRVARRLVGVGIVASLPTVASGLSDWHDTSGETKRVGVVHAAANILALAFEIASWRARGKGHRLRGAALSGAGLSALTFGGYLGGHLVFSQRIGVDHEVPTVDLTGWRAVARLEELPDETPHGVEVDGVRIALVRRGDLVYAMAAVCSHAGGPLDQGELCDSALRCPWHGSEFALYDGSVVRGPAATAQPVYDARVRNGVVEVRGPVALDEPHAGERVRFALANSG
jgi:nitrite reductase/ring-hydroxylating ferredoxin subunit